MRIVHLWWGGPFSLTQLQSLRDETRDYGIYAVYGGHPLYGNDVLLYLGKAAEQTIGIRIAQENWQFHEDTRNLKIYVGRLCGPQNCSNEEWSELIADAESLMIYAHTPAYNSSGLNTMREERIGDLHVFNWGLYRQLLPEVSGLRWGMAFEDLGKESVFTFKENP